MTVNSRCHGQHIIEGTGIHKGYRTEEKAQSCRSFLYNCTSFFRDVSIDDCQPGVDLRGGRVCTNEKKNLPKTQMNICFL